MQLCQLRPSTKNKKNKRLGRGVGSGHGKTSTRGSNGAGQRKGSAHYIGFEGGNVPFLRKIPKRGFTSLHPKMFQIVNLGDIIKRLKGAKEITPSELMKVNLIKDVTKPVKILAKLESQSAGGQNSLDWPATFKANKFSQSALKIIERAGGKTECFHR